ncbi:hypothetical protein Ana3638_09200 [Anaerocolumna sedimenticola]|uniref:Carbohydrate kinase PfkB domain-containing protein n=1 Tax=Anaerocolumna sedimenticola TaxID=2696063 RepID=A0A6P1TLB7_9FIRM|nr:carbohydrate kinase family protein [Anaerocolumna sedimenticola]QHQ60922.1 hypothetical protein Ana3638_09200 [Anaerocolumna sedimenticola]
MDVIGLGTLAMDILRKVDKLPGEDSFCIVENTAYAPGGSGTNVIVQMARLGAKCGYVGKVSDDKIGEEIIVNLKQEGVDTSFMVIKKGGTTLHTEIVIDRAGKKFILLNLGDVFHTLGVDEVNTEAIQTAAVFYTDLLPFEPAVKGLKTAKESGRKTAFNMQTGLDTMKGFGISKEDIFNVLPYTDVFAPCQEGLYALTDTTDLEECRKRLRKYCSGVLLFTLGSKGSVAYDKEDNRYEIPCRKINCVDTTGAGDSYLGSFLYSYFLKKDSLENSMKLATDCAAYTCTGIGARYSPTVEQIKNFVKLD